MVIFLNIDGTAEKVVPERVYQGSNNVTEITVVAPFASNTTMQIGFILPSELYWQSTDGERYAPMSLAEQNTVEGVSAWSFTLPFSVTEREGDVFVAINAITTTGNRTSYLCKITVEESVLPPLPTEPEPSAYDLIKQYIARLDARTANVPNLVASIQKVAPNAITYTNNSGIESAHIVIEGGETAPIPVNAASTVNIAKDAWQPVYSEQTVTGYTIVIDASLHGQMRDGATAADLWLSFDEIAEDGVISGAYQGYTVSESGDITINVNQPVAMTLRVWNGKGLVDEVARDMVETETKRAETEESNLQSQIDEIVQSGVDLTARAQIAAETERAEAEEARLQADINAEAARATAAEGVLTSDIQGLREDITNESHFRGMFDNVEALLEAYPTATPNDYAYIVGGNQWIYQNGEWTDSDVPSPNTAVPASDATPLMDGVANAGTSSKFARGDHRHPENTNKANVDGTYPDMTVGTATKSEYLTSEFTIDGLRFQGTTDVARYATCSTNATTQIKQASILYPGTSNLINTGFKLVQGTIVVVKFSNENTRNFPTLNVNNTGAKPIKADGDTIYVKWPAGAVMEFVYDGTNWVCLSGYALRGMRKGYIYTSDDSTSPETLYGGSWTQINDRFLLAAGDTYTAGDTGGEATHTLTLNEIPSHTHDIRVMNTNSNSSPPATYVKAGENSAETRAVTFASGGSEAHNNMPPYLTVYMWRRIA